MVEDVVETAGVIVHLVEDAGNVNWEIARTITRVWPSGSIRDVGFVVGRVGVLAVPTALEVLGDKMRQSDLLGSCKLNSRVEREHRLGTLLLGGNPIWYWYR